MIVNVKSQVNKFVWHKKVTRSLVSEFTHVEECHSSRWNKAIGWFLPRH